MNSVAIRQSGGANIVSIPKAIVKTLGLHVGSKLELSIDGSRIILTPMQDKLTLEMLLVNSPKACFSMTPEDKNWLNSPSVGGEF